MRVELESGSWIELREQLLGSDRIATQGALRVKIKDGQEQEVGADVTDRMHDALLANIITAWSYPEPIPALLGGRDSVAAIDIDDYNELHDKTVNLFKKVSKSPN